MQYGDRLEKSYKKIDEMVGKNSKIDVVSFIIYITKTYGISEKAILRRLKLLRKQGFIPDNKDEDFEI